MLGYVCKDAGEAHFRLVVSGVTSADLLEGMHLYQIYGESSLKKRKELGHTNWMERAFHWVISRFGGFEDVRFSVAATLTAMVRSGRYYPSAAWSLCRACRAVVVGIRERKSAEQGGAAGPSGSGGVAAANCCTPSKKRVLEFERGNVRLPGSAAGPAPKRAAAMPSIVLVTSSDEEWDMAAADIAAKYDGKLDRELGEIADAEAEAEADAEDSEAAEAQGSE
ncbi:hypothetical protein HXX76_015779 [Chlamydomonas incerta]|uniref:Replitron HUH endonuclease domain-containing protein n=1 Tax=Chlamydomonas incerta TaxID=51695 RepID=A0A835VRE5_CHLIN|nr:hypothetical protein HXX76_015779 [Chlamydomonas incerta]|eukprot:KAG2422759.1 hypothetical protein HXX76_015779 [Chlamydomonas incerta]